VYQAKVGVLILNAQKNHATIIPQKVTTLGTASHALNVANHTCYHATVCQGKVEALMSSAQNNHSTTSFHTLNNGAESDVQNAADHITIKTGYGVTVCRTEVEVLIFSAQNNTASTLTPLHTGGTMGDIQSQDRAI